MNSTHFMLVCPTSLTGIDSGRVRYRVECLTCGVICHEATTAPHIRVQEHMTNPTKLGYGRPMTNEERVLALKVVAP